MYLATAAAHAIRRVSAEPRLVERAQASAAALRDAALSGRVPGFTTDADACSPIVPLRLAVGASVADENALLADVAARARRRGIGVCVARVNPLVPPDRRPPRALRCFASAAHTREDLATAFQVLAEESAKVLPSHALSAAVDASPGAKKRLGADPGSMVMNPPGQQPPKAGGYGSPKNAPGAKVNLDGTISLNNDSVKRDLFANGSNGVGERFLERVLAEQARGQLLLAVGRQVEGPARPGGT